MSEGSVAMMARLRRDGYRIVGVRQLARAWHWMLKDAVGSFRLVRLPAGWVPPPGGVK